MAAGLNGVNGALANAFLQMQAAAAAAGFRIGITSGYRTSAEQASLRVRNGCPDKYTSPASSCRVPTAIPGSSNHNHGLALDLNYGPGALAWVQANAGNFGLHFPVSGENWHAELSGGGGHVQGAQQMGAIGYDVEWAQKGMRPEDAQDQLMQSYVDVIAGTNRDALLEAPTDPAIASPAYATEAIETPGLAKDFGGPASTPTGPLRRETQMLPAPGGGQPAAAAGGGGGQWQGNVPPPGYVPPGSGVERWRDIAIAALRYTGQNPTPELVNRLLMQMNSESGGNPMAVNNWDSNAARGDPSKGLMQNIGSAFPDRARELASRGIYDGFANIVASIRYSLNRYGSLERAWRGHGY